MQSFFRVIRACSSVYCMLCLLNEPEHNDPGVVHPTSEKSVIPVNTEHLYNICAMLVRRRRRRADVVQMLYKCFVFAGMFTLDVGMVGAVASHFH